MAFSTNTQAQGFKLEEHREMSQVTTLENVGLGIMEWGRDNSFPQTIKNIISQSPSASSAVSRTARFFKGGEFEGEDTVINPYGLTLRDLVDHMANDLAEIDGYSIQLDYNLKSVVTGVNPIDIEKCRFNSFDELGFSSKISFIESGTTFIAWSQTSLPLIIKSSSKGI